MFIHFHRVARKWIQSPLMQYLLHRKIKRTGLALLAQIIRRFPGTKMVDAHGAADNLPVFCDPDSLRKAFSHCIGPHRGRTHVRIVYRYYPYMARGVRQKLKTELIKPPPLFCFKFSSLLPVASLHHIFLTCLRDKIYFFG